MKKPFFEYYGDKQFVPVKNLRIAEYYNKSTIEGEARDILYESIRANGVKKPVVINTYEGREGVIIDGAEVYAISKELGIYDIPCYDLCVPEVEEQRYHYFFSVMCNEYTVEQIVEHLRSLEFGQYFEGIDQAETYHDKTFETGEQALAKGEKKVQKRQHSFLLRYDDAQVGYLEKLAQMLNAKSLREALLTLLIEVVEGRIPLC